MRQNRYLMIALMYFIVGAWTLTNVGCASLGIGGDSQQEIRKAYAMAVVTYVDMAEVYADAYDTAAPEVQAKWKATVTPRVLQASEALSIWGQALESTDARAAADKAISDVVILLVDMGLLVIK